MNNNNNLLRLRLEQTLSWYQKLLDLYNEELTENKIPSINLYYEGKKELIELLIDDLKMVLSYERS